MYVQKRVSENPFFRIFTRLYLTLYIWAYLTMCEYLPIINVKEDKKN